MTTATDLAMNLAQIKLDLRQLAAPHRHRHHPFDAAIEAAIRNLNRAIVESIDAVGTPGIAPINRSRPTTPEQRLTRHTTWLKKMGKEARADTAGPKEGL